MIQSKLRHRWDYKTLSFTKITYKMNKMLWTTKLARLRFMRCASPPPNTMKEIIFIFHSISNLRNSKEILELRQNITKKKLSKQLSRDRMSYQPSQWVFHCEIWGRFIFLCWSVFNSTYCATKHEEHYGVQKCARSLVSIARWHRTNPEKCRTTDSQLWRTGYSFVNMGYPQRCRDYSGYQSWKFFSKRSKSWGKQRRFFSLIIKLLYN